MRSASVPRRGNGGNGAEGNDGEGSGRGVDRHEMGIDGPGIEEIVVVPWPLLWRDRVQNRAQTSDRYPTIVLVAALCGLFTVAFSVTVLTIAIPRIAREFGTSEGVMTWVVTGPLLLGAIVTPAAGKLADLLGARRVYLVSMFVVTVFAGLAALSWSAGSLIAFRILGASVGVATGPASIAIINRLYPRERRAQAMGYWSLVWAGAPVVGVVAGGPIVESVGWRWIFLGQVPFGLLTLLVCAAVFPETERDRGGKFDLVGALLLAAGTGSLVFALNRAPEWGWSHPGVIGALAAVPVLAFLFLRYEQRIPHQLLPLRYLRERNVMFSMVNYFCINFGYMGAFFLTPFLMQNVLQYSSSKTGYLSIARPLVFAVVGPLAGWLATKIGERINGVVGGVVLVISMLLFCTVTVDTTELVLILALMLSGAAMGITAPAMSSVIANSVAERDLGVVGGAQQMVGQMGFVIGAQMMMTTQQASSAPGAGSYAAGYLVGAAVAVVGTVMALFVRSTVGPGAERRAASTREQPALLDAV